jgi:7-cyano-7-deazaguanine synthase
MACRKLLLFSGGLDSTIVALRERPDTLLYIDWRHPACKFEWRVCKWWQKHYLKVPLIKLKVSPTLSGDFDYIPARNLIFVSLAVNYAVAHNFNEVLIGLRLDSPQPDTTPLWLQALNLFLSVIEPLPIKVVAPLHKVDLRVLRETLRGYPLDRTFSCSLLNGYPCAIYPKDQWCAKCLERELKLRELGFYD